MGKLIIFDEQKKVFHLKNNFYSYVIQIVMDKYLLHRYWGKPLREELAEFYAGHLSALEGGISTEKLLEIRKRI